MEVKPSQEKEPSEEAAPSRGGEGCSVQGLLPFLEAENPTEAVVRIVQAAQNCPSTVMPALLVLIQQEEASVGQKVMVHHSLQALLDRGLEVEPTQGFVAAATQQLRAPLAPHEGPRELQAAASHTLATLARRHFNLVMTELQRHLRPFVQPDEFTLLTLGRMAAGNVYSCIPFLGLTLATLQTVVRWIDDGQRRRALCTALEQMCQAIQIYLQSWEKTSYPQISIQRFSRCLFPLYAYLARRWLPGSDTQVKVAVLKVLSPILSLLLPRKEFQVQIYEDLLLFSEQLQSGLDPVLLTKIMSQILEASLVSHRPVPQLLVQPLARTLCRQICTWRPQKHNRECCVEISHIFLCLAHSHPMELLRAFQGKLQEGPEDVRVTLLLLISEIAGAEGLPEVPSRRQLCVKVVKAVLGDNRARVRLATLQVIGKLLRLGYLEKVDGWPLNYVSLQLAVSSHQLTHLTQSLSLGGLEEKAIEREAVEVLHTAVASERGLSQELWRRLLGYLMQPHYATSAVTLCQALRLLAEQRLRRAFCRKGRLEPVDSPTPQELLSRLLSLAALPLEGSGRGTAVLLLLNALHPEIYQGVADRWWVEVPVLVRYLEGHSEYTLEAGAWEQKLLEFLKKSLQQLQRSTSSSPEEGDGWTLALGKEIAKQMHLASTSSSSSSTEKVFLCKALGMALSFAREEEAERVTLQLTEVLMQTDYADEGQRKGARWCLAFCAEGGLPPVMGALSLFEGKALPSQESQEGSACLHSSQGLPERARVRNALLMLYSSLALRAPWQHLGPHLGGSIIPGILRHYLASTPLERAQDPDLALSFAQSVMEVSLSVQGGGEALALQRTQKQALLDHLVGLIQARSSEALGSPICQQALMALRHLSRVPEPLSHEENMELAQRCLSHLMALPPSKLSGGAVQALYAGTLTALAGLLGTLLAQPTSDRPGSEWFQQVFQLLGYWLASEHEWERARAMQVAAKVLKANYQGSGTLPSGRLLGSLAPFTGDALGTIRQGAGECIRVLLRTTGTTEPTEHARERGLHCAHQGLRSESARLVHLASRQLAKVVSRALPSEEIRPFLQALLEQLRTVSPACDRTALLWFEVATRERQTDLQALVREVASFICSSLQWAEDFSLRGCLARAFCLLAKHHRKAVCDTLVMQPLLQPRARRELWAALMTPQESRTPILKQLLRWLKVEGNGAPSCVPALLALREVLWALDEDDGARLSPPLLSDLCHALLCQLSQDRSREVLVATAAACSVLERYVDQGAGRAAPRRLAVEVLQATLRRAVPEAAQEMDAENTWAFLWEPEHYLWGVSSLARVLARSENHLLGRILHHLLPSLHSSMGAPQDLTLAFCVELTGHPGLRRRPKTLGLLFRQWLATSQEEEDPTLRALSVRGLGNMAEGAPQEARKLEEVLLPALLQGVDDQSSPELARESLTALGKAWGGFRRHHAGRTLQAVARQAHRYLGHPDETLRAAAFELLGQMARVTRPVHAKPFAREAEGNLTALLLHLRDPSPDVAQACCAAFLSCAPFLGLQDLQEETEASLLPMDLSRAWHGQLLGTVCGQLAQTAPALLDALVMEVPRFVQSGTWEGIRLAACKLAGVLADTMDGEQFARLDWEPLLQALQSLCHDSSATMEAVASEATWTIEKKLEQQKKCPADSGSRPQGRRGALGWLFRGRWKGSPGATQAM